MSLNQNDFEHFKDMVELGKMSVDEANVEMVRAARIKVVRGGLPSEVRKALNDAVKRGELGHMKKDGLKPEVYYHPTFDYMARAERNRIAEDAARRMAKCIAPPIPLDPRARKM